MKDYVGHLFIVYECGSKLNHLWMKETIDASKFLSKASSRQRDKGILLSKDIL